MRESNGREMVKKEFGVVLRGILRRREVREAGKREREMQDVRKRGMVEYGRIL